MKSNQLKVLEKPTQDVMLGPMLTLDEACAYLKVSKSFLYKATSGRLISFHKPTGGKLIRFKKEDLDHWLFQNRFDSKNEIAEQLIKGGSK
jgi:excisionase family DNA binding protein